MKTSELTGAALDWAVAKCEGLLCFGYRTDGERFAVEDSDGNIEGFMPSTDWSQGGPIIEREHISLDQRDNGALVLACLNAPNDSELNEIWANGPTPLIAAMRCFVASRLGDEVDVPEELL